MAKITLPFVIDHDDLHKIIDEKIAELKTQYIPKADYENRLKADMVAILEELNLEIDEMFARRIDYTVDRIQDLIQQKINKLRGNENGNK